MGKSQSTRLAHNAPDFPTTVRTASGATGISQLAAFKPNTMAPTLNAIMQTPSNRQKLSDQNWQAPRVMLALS
ncbi:hypothetical protein [Moraxella atlantae]|uniref:hypothetical protein n=1 Tax=Faucicola atlantae TaxID=34059 RepID=UPI000B295CBE